MFKITTKLGCTYLLSDEVEVERLVSLEKRDRQLRSTRISRSYAYCLSIVSRFMG